MDISLYCAILNAVRATKIVFDICIVFGLDASIIQRFRVFYFVEWFSVKNNGISVSHISTLYNTNVVCNHS